MRINIGMYHTFDHNAVSQGSSSLSLGQRVINKIKAWIQSWMSAKSLQMHFPEMSLENIRVMSIQQMSFMETMDYTGENFDQLKTLVKTCFVARLDNSHRLMMYSLIAFVPDKKLTELGEVLSADGNTELSQWIDAEVKRRNPPKPPELPAAPIPVSTETINTPIPEAEKVVVSSDPSKPPLPAAQTTVTAETPVPEASKGIDSSKSPNPSVPTAPPRGDAWELMMLESTKPVDLTRFSLDQLKRHAGNHLKGYGLTDMGDGKIFEELQKRQATVEDYKEIFISFIKNAELYSLSGTPAIFYMNLLYRMHQIIKFDAKNLNDLKERLMDSEKFVFFMQKAPDMRLEDLPVYQFFYPFEFPTQAATEFKVKNVNAFNRYYISDVMKLLKQYPEIASTLNPLTLEHLQIVAKDYSALPTDYKYVLKEG